MDLYATIREPKNQGNHTEYIIDVFMGSLQWTISRRFRQFVEMHEALSEKHIDLPPLPPKRFFGRMDPSFIQERKDKLQQYLAQLLSRDDTLKSRVLSIFLETQKHYENGSGHRQNAHTENPRKNPNEKCNEVIDIAISKFVDLYESPITRYDPEMEHARNNIIDRIIVYTTAVPDIKPFRVPTPTSRYVKHPQEVVGALHAPPALSPSECDLQQACQLIAETVKNIKISRSIQLVTHFSNENTNQE